MKQHSKIAHCLWFDSEAKAAAKFYTSIFKDAAIDQAAQYSKESIVASGKQEGDDLSITFRLENLEFMALNGGPIFKPCPSISFFINCESEAEVDIFWKKLSEGGKVMMPLDTYPFSKKYGWIEDKFGVSWQVMLTSPEGDWRPKLIPCLLFTGKKSGKAKEAIALYTTIFDDTKTGLMVLNDQPGQEGKVLFADFMIGGQWIAAMDSPQEDPFDFSEGNSFMVYCENQQELDYYWEKLAENGGQESNCGWLKDKFGISWQILPKNIAQLVQSPAATKALMQMKKLDIAVLEKA